MYKILQEKMSGVGGEAIDFARSLVETPSLSLAEERVADLVERKMQALGYAKVFRDDYGNVVGLLAGMHSAPTVLLNSHMDTVSASEGASTAPAVQDEQRLYGLGAADCKGGLAAQVFAGALLKRCLLPLKGNFILAATTAEKNGLSIGLRGLLAHTLPELGLKPDFAILGEPTGLGLYYGHDGWMEVDVRLEGITPFAAKDALGLIMHNMAPAQSSQREMLRVLASDHTHMAHQNAVSLRVAKRIGEEEDSQTALTQVKESVQRAAEAAGSRVAVGVAVRDEAHKLYTGKASLVQQVARAWSMDPFHPLIDRARQALEAAGCQVKPGKWQLGRLGMGTGGSVLLNEFDIPVLGYGPGLETQAHAPGEYVEKEKIVEATYGSAIIAHSMVGIPICGWSSDEI